LHYNVKVKQFREEISKEANFKKLSLDNQKELFIKMLDLNQLYVNVSDMEDQKYNLRAADIAVTKDFYQL
jgi:adenine-specific DNA-methyltransferase